GGQESDGAQQPEQWPQAAPRRSGRSGRIRPVSTRPGVRVSHTTCTTMAKSAKAAKRKPQSPGDSVTAERVGPAPSLLRAALPGGAARRSHSLALVRFTTESATPDCGPA